MTDPMQAMQDLRDRCRCSNCWPNYPYFRVCPDCGNKRCPKAKHHDHACTNSNEPGQKGSNYEDALIVQQTDTAKEGA